MTKVEEALAEIQAELARITPIHEGLRDYYSLNVKPETKTVVNQAISLYDQRKLRLEQAQSALQALLANGYPVLDIPPVEQVVFADLAAQKASIDAAMEKFSVNEATTVAIVPGTPTEK